MTDATSATPSRALPGRNEPCHCGSGLKYKKCCSAKDDAARSSELAAQAAARAAKAQAEREQAEAEGATASDAKGAKAGQRHGAAASSRAQRPKLPSPHTSNLPRRGAV